MMRYANLTDVGRQREHNEDNLMSTVFAFGHGRRRAEYALHVVADGMGGAAAGEVASAITVATITQGMFEELLRVHVKEEHDYINLGQMLRISVEQANESVYRTAREQPQFMGMGATVTVVLVCQGKAFIAQVGDSRAYLLREGRLRQVTHDHSFVGELLRDGRITEEQARNHPRKNIITRAVGSRARVQVDVFQEELRPGDVILSCSDGLSGMVPDEEMLATMNAAGGGAMDPMPVCERLVSQANEAGGSDNISCNIVVIEPGDIPAHPTDHVCLVPGTTLTWDEAARLDLGDGSFVPVDL